MPNYNYASQPVYDPISDLVQENATGGKFVLVKDGPAQPLRDQNGNPIGSITSNASGMAIPFQTDYINGFVQFGSLAIPVYANEVAAYALEGHQASIDAANAVDQATLAATSAAAAQASAASLAVGVVRSVNGVSPNSSGAVTIAALGTSTPNTWTGLQTFDGGIAVPDNTLSISDVSGLQTALNNAGSGGGTTLTNYSQVTGLSGYPTSFPPNLGSTAMVPTLTANQKLILVNIERANTTGAIAAGTAGSYDALPSNIPSNMIAVWAGTDDPASGTRTNDWRMVLP